MNEKTSRQSSETYRLVELGERSSTRVQNDVTMRVEKGEKTILVCRSQWSESCEPSCGILQSRFSLGTLKNETGLRT
jgi:hypothetical protein